MKRNENFVNRNQKLLTVGTVFPNEVRPGMRGAGTRDN